MRGALLLVVTLVAGCVVDPPTEPDPGQDVGASAAYDLAAPERLTLRMSDGVVLDGVLWRPEGLARSPLIVEATPYAGVCTFTAPDAPYPKPCAPDLAEDFWIDQYNVLPRALVRAGYAYAVVSVRGTGDSGGCFHYLGPRERQDMGEMLDHLVAEPWVDGIGMAGLSYMAITPLEAMAERPGVVKAVVIGGVGFDEYVFSHTPQGASSVSTTAFWGSWSSTVAGPRLTSPRSMMLSHERACPELVTTEATPPLSHLLDERDRQHFMERRYLDTLRDLPTGMLVLQGIKDRAGGQQIEVLWPALGSTPAALVLGQWEHRFPDDVLLEGSGLTWPELPIAWLDHFLRAGPAPDVLSRTIVGVEEGAWERHGMWPPPGIEALYLGETLGDTPDEGALSFLLRPEARACDDAPGTWVVAMTEPLAEAVQIVGNPMAWLELETSSSSATVGVDLWDVPGDDVCAGARIISYGAADLRFLEDPFQGRDVPVGETLGVRVDMHAAAYELAAGHRIAVTLSTAGVHGASGRVGAGTVTISGASHVLVPTDEGVGALPPAMEYPARPFGPGYRPP